MKKSPLFAAATAISAMGFVTVPGPAQADPMIPLAPPNCERYEFTAPFEYTQDNGYTFQFPAIGDRIQGRAMYAIVGQTEGTFGPANGGISGRTININVTWDQGPGKGLWSQITGQINDDLFASGTAKNSQGVSNTWKTSFKQKCVPAAPVVKPPDQPPKVDPPKNTATVVSPTNIWTAPSHLGGIQLFNDDGSPRTLTNGDVLTSVEPGCTKDTWCVGINPKIPTDGNKGAVWGGQVTPPAG